jgi:hypothetical protein
MIYENIITEDQLREFVDSLNKITHYEKYLLFNNIFETGIYELKPKDLPKTETTYFQKWIFPVGPYFVFASVKINLENPTVNPEFKTGFYEKIYFHLKPDDNGISQL